MRGKKNEDKSSNLHAKIKSWQLHGILSLCWSFYYVNDNIEIDLENTQIMCCILVIKNM